MGQQIGERVIVAGKGDGTLEYYGRVRRSQTDHGKIMCGVSLDDRVGQFLLCFSLFTFFFSITHSRQSPQTRFSLPRPLQAPAACIQLPSF